MLLFPKEKINEKFLLKIRNCFPRISDHPILKNWMMKLNRNPISDVDNQKRIDFLKEVAHSNYNLIFEPKMREQIIQIIFKIPSDSFSGKILKSYLYLILGYVAKSDSLLKEIISTPPFKFWKSTAASVFEIDFFVQENLEQILKKMKNHPSSRDVFNFFCFYLDTFFKIDEKYALAKNCEIDDEIISNDLMYFRDISSELIDFISILKKDNSKRKDFLISKYNQDKKYFIEWLWPIWSKVDFDFSVLNKDLKKIEIEDKIFFYFVIQTEKLKENFSQMENRSFLVGSVNELLFLIKKPELFMLSLYKLLEFGYVKEDLVREVSEYLSNYGL